MEQLKLLLILINVLICSAIIAADHHHPVGDRTHHGNRHNHHILKKSHKIHYKSLDEPAKCHWVCDGSDRANNATDKPSPSPNDNEGGVSIVSRGDIVGVYNSSSNVAILYNQVQPLAIAFLYGQSGQAYVIDIKASIAYLLGKNSAESWKSTESLDAYLKKTSNLQVLLDAGKKSGTNLNLSDANLVAFATQVAAQLNGADYSLADIIQDYVDQNKLSPARVFENDTNVRGVKGLKWVSSVELGLLHLFEAVPGGLEAIRKLGIQLNLTSLLHGSSGIDVVLKALIQIGEKTDLAKLFGSTLNNPEKFLEVIASFRRHSGVDGILNIIHQIISTVNQHGSFEGLVKAILEFGRNGGPLSVVGPDLTHLTKDFLNLTSSQNAIYHNAPQLSGFVRFLESLADHNCFVNDVDVSSIVKILSSGDFPGGLQLVIKIFTQLGPKFAAGIPDIARQIFGLFSGSDSGIINSLIPGVNVGSLGNSSNIFGSITKGLNLSDITSGNSNITSAFSHIPVFGDIVSQLQKGFGGAFDIQRVFNTSSFTDLFKNSPLSGLFDAFRQNPIGGIIANLTQGGGPFGQIIGGISNNSGGAGGILGGAGGILGGLTPPGLGSIPILGSLFGGGGAGASVPAGGVSLGNTQAPGGGSSPAETSTGNSSPGGESTTAAPRDRKAHVHGRHHLKHRHQHHHN